jgi:tetratricopeptide (TPR) repeat protein
MLCLLVGGTGAEVALCDLRMTGGNSAGNAKVIHQYRPRCFHENNDNVSVSGLDLSRDKKELLVSYESDQIYTFPIFPNARSAAGPTLEEMGGVGDESMAEEEDGAALNGSMSMMADRSIDRSQSGEDIFYSELAAYGGHLNRFTFLKNAKYAGPNDEYICTGSDSGHAWIYERSTGAVVSLLNADHSTCNGVIPHPSLPFFITYGIDSTAKLWRATRPVDPNMDDSPRGRAKCFYESPYEMSPLTREWDSIRQEIFSMEQDQAEAEIDREEDDEPFQGSFKVLPDQVLSRKELIRSGSFGRSILRRFDTPGGAGGTRIGNDLCNLPDVLRRNQYECIRAVVAGGRRRDIPVEGDLNELMRRISLLRLRHQADRQGIAGHWKASVPWIMSNEASAGDDENSSKDTDDTDRSDVEMHPADLVPDNPSDWIPYDPEMTPEIRPYGLSFNIEEYSDFYRQRYLYSDEDKDGIGEEQTGLAWILAEEARGGGEEGDSPMSPSENARKILYETAKVLKEGGNEALRAGDFDVAARRYDKAIRYCAVAFIPQHASSFYAGKGEDEVERMEKKLSELDMYPGPVSPMMLQWTPLLKVLISTRLNLAMLLLKQGKDQQDASQPERTIDQARRALRELQPFCLEKGKICLSLSSSGSGTRLGSCCSSKNKNEVMKSGESDETYREAKTLQSKAFFRLGSAQSDMGQYAEAIRSFEKSIACSVELDPEAKLDALVVRRLAEAKRERNRKNKRTRKKYRMMLGQDDGEVVESRTSTVRDIPDDRRDRRKDARRPTAAAIVSPSTPMSSAARAASEERATQSE